MQIIDCRRSPVHIIISETCPARLPKRVTDKFIHDQVPEISLLTVMPSVNVDI